MARRFESFIIDKIDENGNMRGRTSEGKVREFAIAVNRDLATNQLSFSVVRHFTVASSVAAFVGSEPWTKDELRGVDTGFRTIEELEEAGEEKPE